jgi:hypothetical protein
MALGLATREQPARADATALLDELEEAIDGLRIAFEKYFLGVDRVAPMRMRDRVDRQLRSIEHMHMSSTALRFRLAGLRARLVTYGHYWNRVLGEMERGTFRRDLHRARAPEPEAPDAAKPATTPSTPSPARDDASREEQAAAAHGLDPAHVRDVFDRLVAAKRENGEATDGLTFGAFVRKLAREVPRLRERKATGPIRFEVTRDGGKVVVRARTRDPVPDPGAAAP